MIHPEADTVGKVEKWGMEISKEAFFLPNGEWRPGYEQRRAYPNSTLPRIPTFLSVGSFFCQKDLSRKERLRKEWSMIAVLSGMKPRPASLPCRALRLAQDTSLRTLT
jgi:hypothetical protein